MSVSSRKRKVVVHDEGLTTAAQLLQDAANCSAPSAACTCASHLLAVLAQAHETPKFVDPHCLEDAEWIDPGVPPFSSCAVSSAACMAGAVVHAATLSPPCPVDNTVALFARDGLGNSIRVEINRLTPMRKLMDAWCGQFQLQQSTVRLFVYQEHLEPQDTAE